MAGCSAAERPTMAPKPKKNEPPPPEPEEDLGELPEFEFEYLPVVVRAVVASDLDQALVDAWICEREGIAVPLSVNDALNDAAADPEGELAVALADAKQKDTEAGSEFR